MRESTFKPKPIPKAAGHVTVTPGCTVDVARQCNSVLAKMYGSARGAGYWFQELFQLAIQLEERQFHDSIVAFRTDAETNLIPEEVRKCLISD